MASIVTKALNGVYYKPIQSGFPCDTAFVRSMGNQCLDPGITLKHPLSPHAAADLENLYLTDQMIPKHQKDLLIIEMAGGVMVPLNQKDLLFEYFKSLKGRWILVSKHYLGSINHTLLTYDFLKSQCVDLQGLIFNGEKNTYTEEFLIEYTQLPVIGRLHTHETLNQKVITWYATQWKASLQKIVKSSGTPFLKQKQQSIL